MIPLGDIASGGNPVETDAARVARVGLGFPVETPEQRQQAAQRSLAVLEQEAAADPTLAADPAHQRERARAAEIAGVKPAPTKPPPTWDEVVKMPEMQGLSSEQLEQARNQYFDDVVAPVVPLGMLQEARTAFDADTKPGTLSRAVGAIKDAVSEIKKQGVTEWATKGLHLAPETLDQLERSYRGLKQGAFATGLVFNQHQLNVMDRIDRGEAVGETDDPIGYQHMNPQERAEIKSRVQAGRVEQLQTLAKEAVEISGLYQNPNAVEAIKAANTGEWRKAWDAFKADPVGIVKDLSLSNSVQIAPMVALGVAGGVVKGVPGLMLGFAGGSFPVDYAMSLVEYLQDQGVDLKNYSAVDAKIREPGFLEQWTTYAGRHAAGVTAGDVAAGGLMRPVAGTIGKAVTAAVRNTAAGIAGEAGGEAAGELLAEGKIKPGDVIAEGLAAGPTTVAGSTAATIAAQRANGKAQAAQAAATEPLQAADVLGTETPPADPNAAAPSSSTRPPPPRGPGAEAAAAATSTESADATQQGQVPGSDQRQHQGADGQRPSAEAGGGDLFAKGGEGEKTSGDAAVSRRDDGEEGDSIASEADSHSALPLRRDVEVVPSKVIVEGSGGHAKTVGDLLDVEALRSKGLSGLDVPSQRMVVASVLARANDPKILDSVVGPVAVDMVNMLGGKQVTAEMLRHDPTVLKDAFASAKDVGISAVTDKAMLERLGAAVIPVADLVAKTPLAFRKVTRAFEPPAAEGAGQHGAAGKTEAVRGTEVTAFSGEGARSLEDASAGRASDVDRAAHEAATSPKNDLPAPTQAQREAGNYRKGHFRISGLDVSIENPSGSRRRPEWPELRDHYGYLRGARGADGDHVDVFVKPGEKRLDRTVFVVNQAKPDGSFDEHKVMLGYGSKEDARAAYIANNGDPQKARKRIRSIVSMPFEDFKNWAFSHFKGPSKGELVLPPTHYVDEKLVIHSVEKGKPVPEGAKTFTNFEDAREHRIATLKREAAEKKKIDVQRDTITDAIIKLGGLSMDERVDVAGDDKAQKSINGVGHLFTRGGTGVDDMARLLEQYGFVTQGEIESAKDTGGTRILVERIRDELAGRRKHFSMNSDAALEDEERRQREIDEDRAKHEEALAAEEEAQAKAAADAAAAALAEKWAGLTEEEQNAELDAFFGPQKTAAAGASSSEATREGEARRGASEEEEAGPEAGEREPGADDEEVADKAAEAASKYDTTTVASLEKRFGSDEALGTIFPPEEEDRPSHFADGRDAVICTNCAIQVVRALGKRAQIWGFSETENPDARVVKEAETGHDFAIVDGRYLVDPWIKLVPEYLSRAVYDLQDPADAKIVREWYGDRKNWSRLEEAEKLAPTNYDEHGNVAKQPAPLYDLDEDGPRLIGDKVAIVQPSKWRSVGDLTYYEHLILDLASRKVVGNVTLGWRGGKVGQLLNIRIFAPKQAKGIGEAVIRNILELNGDAGLHVAYIAHSARGFWRKMGVRFFQTEEGEDGVASLQTYRAARPGQTGKKPRSDRAEEPVGEGAEEGRRSRGEAQKGVGREVSEGGRANAARQPDRAPEQLNLFHARPLPDVQGAQELYATVVEPKEARKAAVGVERVKSAEDAAHVLAFLRKSPMEKFLALVTDRDGKPLAILPLTQGSRVETAAYPGEIAQTVHQVEGAKKVWFAHNHPSARPIPSTADLRMAKNIESLLEGSGLDVDQIIIAGKTASVFHESGALREFPIPAMNRKFTVSVKERKLLKRGGLGDVMTKPDHVRAIVNRLFKDQEGVLLSDAGGLPVAWVPMKPSEIGQLRKEGRSSRLFRALGKSNAYQAVLVMKSDEQADRDDLINLGNFMKWNGGRLMDVVFHSGGETAAERGWDLSDPFARSEMPGPFFRRDPAGGRASRGLSIERARVYATTLMRKWKNAPKLHVVGDVSQLPFEAKPDALGAFWRGGLYLVAGNHASTTELEATIFHEALGHAGLRGVFGKSLDGVLERIWATNANVRRAAADWMAFNEKPKDWSAKDFRLQAIEESLADIAGSGKKFNGLRQLIAAIQKWLRAHGFGRTADWLESLSDAEALGVLAKAEAYITADNEPQVLTPEMAAQFSRPKPVFYSELARRVAAIDMPAAPAEQWRSLIKNMQGVKPDEIEWSGVMEWLALQKGKVKREDIVAYLAENGVKVEETVLGESDRKAYNEAANAAARFNEEAARLWREKIDKAIPPIRGVDRANLPWWAFEMVEKASTDERRKDAETKARGVGLNDEQIAMLKEYGELREKFVEANDQAQALRTNDQDAKFATYTLQGGKDYRELLLTLPDKSQLPPNVTIRKKAEHNWITVVDGREVDSHMSETAAREAALGNYGGSGSMFRSSHFDRPNILAHVRFNERTDADGKRVLFLEEIQSDWAQKGRRDGFRGESQNYKARQEKDGTWSAADDAGGGEGGFATREEAQAWANRENAQDPVAVPRGPFVGKTDAWVSLALKRMIAWAAQEGFDRIAWTNGDQQAERYDLSKHVAHINWFRYAGGSYSIEVYGKNYHDGGRPIIEKEDQTESQLADLIGKEAAAKIVEGAKTKSRGSLSDLDLKIGGEGMRDFYDRIVQKVANDVLKKLGGGRVGEVNLRPHAEINKPSGETIRAPLTDKDTADRTGMQPGFDITPALRASVREGVPMFSRATGRRPPRRESLFNAAVRIPTQAVRFDKLTSWAYDTLILKLGGMLTPETVKAGMGHDYGIPEAVSDRRSVMWGNMRRQLRYAQGTLDKIMQLTRAERRVAYAWMNDRNAEHLLEQLPEESRQVLRDVKTWIDSMSREAVRLGDLSAEVYERNKNAYVHRSYLKYERERPKQETAARARAIQILGQQYKGRGMVEAVDMAKLKAAAPEWWGRKLREGRGDRGLKGQKFIRLERRENRGEGTGILPGVEAAEQLGRIREIAYWPAGEAVPEKYSTWRRDAGEWEVRDTKGAKVVLWRDFTLEEQHKMGVIDDVAFAVAKTFQQMIHDVETSRYLEYLANQHGRTDEQLPRDAKVVEAKESLFRTFAKDEWVLVPEGKIAGTDVKRYGKLSGLYIPGPIWNDVRQVTNARYAPLGDLYATLLKAWKVSKTALSPAVHMNNVMANIIMADWHDVLARDLVKALRVIAAAGVKPEVKGVAARVGRAVRKITAAGFDPQDAKDIIAAYEDNGGSQGTFALSEIQREQLKPLIESLEREVAQTEGAGMVNAAGVLQAMLAGKYREAISAMSSGKGTRVAMKAAGLMIDLYQAEDTVFRLAAFIKAKEEGKSDIEAGKAARNSFLDYHINAPWVQMMRSTVFPFIGFVYRAAPMLLETAARKPWKLMKLAMVIGGLNALGYMLSGGDEDKERKLLPKEKVGRIFGFIGPKLIRMPWNDQHGSPVFLDIRRFIPVGDVFDLGQTHAAIPWLPAAIPGGPLALAAEVLANKSQFTGKPITNESDTGVIRALSELKLSHFGTEQEAKLFAHIWQSVAPNLPFLPGTYAFKDVAEAGKGKTDPFGRERSLPQALASSVGVKVGAYPADVAKLGIKAELGKAEDEIRREIRSLAREHARRGISSEEFERRKNYQVEKLKQAERDAQERLR